MLLLKRGNILTKRRKKFSTQGAILKTSLVGSQKTVLKWMGKT